MPWAAWLALIEPVALRLLRHNSSCSVDDVSAAMKLSRSAARTRVIRPLSVTTGNDVFINRCADRTEIERRSAISLALSNREPGSESVDCELAPASAQR